MLALSTKLECIALDRALHRLVHVAEENHELAVIEVAKNVRLFVQRWYAQALASHDVESVPREFGAQLRRKMDLVTRLVKDSHATK
jgi:hypothetical protein